LSEEGLANINHITGEEEIQEKMQRETPVNEKNISMNQFNVS